MKVYFVNLFGGYSDHGHMIVAAPTEADAIALARSVEKNYSVADEAALMPGVRSGRRKPAVLHSQYDGF